jgi:hypothetical protein
MLTQAYKKRKPRRTNAEILARHQRATAFHEAGHAVIDIALLLCRGVEDTANALREWLCLDTRDRLAAPLAWAAVERLADALEARKTLGYRAQPRKGSAHTRPSEFHTVFWSEFTNAFRGNMSPVC